MKEEWNIVDECRTYSVSNFGRVKNNYNNYILKNYISSTGNPTVMLMTNEGKTKQFKVSRLVMKAFKRPDLGSEDFVMPKDGNKLNIRLDNLVVREPCDKNIRQGKKVLMVDKAIMFNSIAECARYLNCSPAMVTYAIKRNKKIKRHKLKFA